MPYLSAQCQNHYRPCQLNCWQGRARLEAESNASLCNAAFFHGERELTIWAKESTAQSNLSQLASRGKKSFNHRFNENGKTLYKTNKEKRVPSSPSHPGKAAPLAASLTPTSFPRSSKQKDSL